jgi:small subunit ribosomal protein S11
MRTVTGGSDKDFKKAHRSSYEAAHQASIKMFDCIRDYARGNPLSEKKVASSADGHQMKPRIRVAFKGMFGQGREAVASALLGPEGVAVKNMIVRMEDRTPIKIGGTRPRKARRL